MSIANMVSIMVTVQSNLSANQSNPSAIELADRAQRRVFVVSVVFGVVAALIAALLAWLLWRANNTYQSAVSTETNARVEESKALGSQANERAQQANESAQNLEKENLTLRGQVATLETQAANATKDMARLQKDAADAKAAQQRVELDLSRQQERTARVESALAGQQERAATAERQLLELQQELEKRTAPRTLTAEQRSRLQGFLMLKPKGSIEIQCVAGTTEPCEFARQIGDVLRLVGWEVFVNDVFMRMPTPAGLLITVRSRNAPPEAAFLQQGLDAIGFPAPAEVGNVNENFSVALIVGVKPPQ